MSWLVSFALSWYCIIVAYGLNEEGFALLSLKQAITLDPFGSLTNWNNTLSGNGNENDQNPCSWNGVSCSKQYKVVSLSIPKKGLVGYLPKELSVLTSLRHVNLRGNKFEGSIPVELFSIGTLQSLVLNENMFSGVLSGEVGKLKLLQTLDLSGNMIEGEVPGGLIGCKRLRMLYLSRNNFSGELPTGFGSGLVALERLDLSWNRFSGKILEDFGELKRLEGTVDLSHNGFEGAIPGSLGDLPEKVYIDLSYNNLSGRIPQNGALENRGPTAFIGNAGLCGPPLKTMCPEGTPTAESPAFDPFVPGDNLPLISNDKVSGGEKRRGLSKITVIAIVVSDVIGICVIGLIFSYCYWRLWLCSCKKGSKDRDDGKGRKDCFCFRKDESETLSENVEHYDLVPLDAEVRFDLDELLKASAFVLGKSGIGIMYKVVLEDGLILAVRRLGEGGSQRFKEFQSEVEAIGKIRHPNIVTLRAYYWSVDEKLLIYNYIPNGNLEATVHGKDGNVAFTPLVWSVRLVVIKGIAKGLAYLHEFSPKKYVHGNLQPSNILLGHDMEPQISDFGLGRLANIAGGYSTLQSDRLKSDKTQQHATPSEVLIVSPTLKSDVCYQAPEALKVVKPSQKWDVYSFGVILLELISGRSPTVQIGTSEMNLVQWVEFCIEEKCPLADVLDPFLAREPEKEEDIVTVLRIALACVQVIPERRPSMKHILEILTKLNVSTD